ncbi:MAG: right-handed parallel beta-helix repeat-containing protein [bacterium]|nr:right-handed parallel beta-helix repeat-containing protein [bacterium]
MNVNKILTVSGIGGPAQTILDGSLANNHIMAVSAGAFTSGTVIEGFTFRGDDADAALYCFHADVTVRDCVFEDNQPTQGAAVVSAELSRATFENCRFSNSAGGALWIDNRIAGGDVTLDGCEFLTNTGDPAFELVGTDVQARSLTIRNTLFRSNTGADGGAVRLGAESLTVQIDRCSFLDNDATSGGAMLLTRGATGWMRNSILAGNTAVALGSALHLAESSSLEIANSTFYGNNANAIAQESGASTIINSILWLGGGFVNGNVTITYSDVQGGFAGEGNIDADPRFVDPFVNDYRLQRSSPCIDAGDTTFWSDMADGQTVPVDIENEPRVVNTIRVPNTGRTVIGLTVDMGAVERTFNCTQY